MASDNDVLGSVLSLWRYPVKSMMGEELQACAVTDRGLLGDRAYALIDPTNGKVVSAKNPKKWGRLFEFGASFDDQLRVGEPIPAVSVTFPDGTRVSSDAKDLADGLSGELGREVAFEVTAPETPSLEEYWPDIEGLAFKETVTDEAMPTGTFFDLAVIHILTTSTLDRLAELYPDGRFEVRRFRPNIFVQPASGEVDFVENNWIGHTLSIGDQVRLSITGGCPRCVMTTLPQGDLPKDPGILRTAAQHNKVHVGVYASVLQGGEVRAGDPVRLE